MAGTVVLALLPLYLTAWDDAVYDDALLVLAVAFSADAIFRCLDPANARDNPTVVFAVGSVVMLTLSLLQYGPIANDLRKEKSAMLSSFTKGSIQPLAAFEADRKEDEKTFPTARWRFCFPVSRWNSAL